MTEIFFFVKDKKYFRRGDLEKQKAEEYRKKQEVGYKYRFFVWEMLVVSFFPSLLIEIQGKQK